MGKRLFWSRDRLVKHNFDFLGLGFGNLGIIPFNLTFGRHEKIFGLQNTPRGGKKL